MKRNVEGFTLIELFIVMAIFGLLAVFAISGYQRLVRETRVMQAIADLQAVRAAAYIYYGDTATWPRETPPGVVPRELADRLPPSFRFANPRYRIDWDNWVGIRGALRYPRTGVAVGVAVVSADRQLIRSVALLLDKAPVVPINPNKITLKIAGPEGI
jgi:prepilin-type N-terminal cleavage/methylation domain-containing protein